MLKLIFKIIFVLLIIAIVALISAKIKKDRIKKLFLALIAAVLLTLIIPFEYLLRDYSLKKAIEKNYLERPYSNTQILVETDNCAFFFAPNGELNVASKTNSKWMVNSWLTRKKEIQTNSTTSVLIIKSKFCNHWIVFVQHNPADSYSMSDSLNSEFFDATPDYVELANPLHSYALIEYSGEYYVFADGKEFIFYL